MALGKTTLTRKIQDSKTVVVSLDDFYFPHNEMCALGDNPVFSFRGLPGTHDYALLSGVLEQLTSEQFVPLKLPHYDKCANNGLGDRIPSAGLLVVRRPELIILEGWCLDLLPLDTVNEKIFEPVNVGIAQIKGIVDRFCNIRVALVPHEVESICDWRRENPNGMTKLQLEAFIANMAKVYKEWPHRQDFIHFYIDKSRQFLTS